MSRRKPRVQYSLDSGNVKNLLHEEISAILRGADELIATGGRRLRKNCSSGSVRMWKRNMPGLFWK